MPMILDGAANGSTSRNPGTEPAGDYPIHIIVSGGRVTLIGVVDSESDKTVAGIRTREVPGFFAIGNEIVVEQSNPGT